MVATRDSTKNDFSSNFMAIIPGLTTNLVFTVISANSISIELIFILHIQVEESLKEPQKDL